ncbi:hypothetical protein D3C77_583560 [compost metagenome]
MGYFRLLDEQRLHQLQGDGFNPFGAGLVGKLLGLQVIQRIDAALVDDLEGALGLHKLHKAFQRIAQPLIGYRFDDVVEGSIADRLATGIHVAGGGDKNHRATGLFHRGFFH